MLLIILFVLIFTTIAWLRFNFSLVLLFLLLPTYLIRFHIGPLPTTLLEIMIGIITIIWLIKYNRSIIPNLKSSILNHKSLFIAIGLFLLAATISIFTSSDLRSALGEWKAFYVEPIIIFLILITSLKNSQSNLAEENTNKILTKYEKNTNSNILIIFYSYFNNIFSFKKINFVNAILYGLTFSGLILSFLAIFQHFTGWMVPDDFWQNRNTFRVTGWYGYPNGVGLFLAPLFILCIHTIAQSFSKLRIRNWKLETGNCWPYFSLISSFIFLISSLFAIYFARSTSALVGIAGGIGFLLLMHKKTRWPAIIIGLIGIVSFLSFPQLSSLRNEIFLQDRSGQIRISIWKETGIFLKNNPIAGAGLASYSEKIEPYHTTVNGEGIEIFHHPHNIFLTMYVNLGLLGLVSFLYILIWFIKNCFQISNFKFQIFLLSSMITILIMGLVDSPYIKNDLALMFWLLPALLIINSNNSNQTNGGII